MSSTEDRLCDALGLGADASAILEPLHALYTQLDTDVGLAAEGLELPCKSGCDACCHESVFLSAPEFLAVAVELMRTRSQVELRSVVDEMVRLAERFADELELLDELAAGAERDEVAMRVKFRCPLLSASGQCTVYSARELNGRTFGQAWDEQRHEAYGCDLTRERLQVIGSDAGCGMVDARRARWRLVAAVPGTAVVQVYPWWFARYGALLFP